MATISAPLLAVVSFRPVKKTALYRKTPVSPRLKSPASCRKFFGSGKPRASPRDCHAARGISTSAAIRKRQLAAKKGGASPTAKRAATKVPPQKNVVTTSFR
jgi:hypothetical protein